MSPQVRQLIHQIWEKTLTLANVGSVQAQEHDTSLVLRARHRKEFVHFVVTVLGSGHVSNSTSASDYPAFLWRNHGSLEATAYHSTSTRRDLNWFKWHCQNIVAFALIITLPRVGLFILRVIPPRTSPWGSSRVSLLVQGQSTPHRKCRSFHGQSCLLWTLQFTLSVYRMSLSIPLIVQRSSFSVTSWLQFCMKTRLPSSICLNKRRMESPSKSVRTMNLRPFYDSCARARHARLVTRVCFTKERELGKRESTDAVFCLDLCAVSRQKRHLYHMRNIELCPKDLYSLFGSWLQRISTQTVSTRLSYSVQNTKRDHIPTTRLTLSCDRS